MNAFGPAVVSIVLLTLYGAHLMGFGPTWGTADEETMKMICVMVASYWVGSSHGSDRKTEMMHGDEPKV